jgi:hypothetical protein
VRLHHTHIHKRLCPCTKTDISYSFWKVQAWNLEHRLLTPCGSHRNCILGARVQYAPILSIVRAWALKKKILVGFYFYFLLPYRLCYILLHYFNISTNFKVFSFPMYQLYAYPGFRAWATGSLLWECHSGRNWEKRDLALINSWVEDFNWVEDLVDFR